ncbi:hypothetical protein TNCV_831261 [Trichonephila clavipes]|nr:hypothetical protein TNCV_831261 [Trichonephila clavipes]
MNIKIHQHPTTNRRAPLPSTDTEASRKTTVPPTDRSHHINATTNQKASRNTGGRNHLLHTQHRHEKLPPHWTGNEPS